MSKYCFLFFCFGIWACNETSKDKKAVVGSDSVIIASNQINAVTREPNVTDKPSGPSNIIDCDATLNLMFQTSSYRPFLTYLKLSDFRIHVNEPADSIDYSLGIRIFSVGENDSDSALVGLLNLDLETGKFVDLSPQLDSAVELTYDSTYLKIIRENCGKLPPGLY